LLFLIPADSNDIKKDFEILLHELKMYNPELLTKERVLAISKSDMLDEELMKLMKKTLPKKIDVVFISAVSGLNLNQLKEILWEKMNK
jgi:GTP-binding protein